MSRFDRPDSVNAFVWLNIVAMTFGVLAGLLFPPKLAPALQAQIDAMPPLQVYAFSFATAVVLPGTLIWLTARRHNWARIAIALLFAIGVVTSWVTASPLQDNTWLASLRSCVIAALQLGSLAFVFSPRANEWFKEEDWEQE